MVLDEPPPEDGEAGATAWDAELAADDAAA
jgi:hypothetical protein